MTASEIKRALPLALSLNYSGLASAATQIGHLNALTDKVNTIVDKKAGEIFRINNAKSLMTSMDSVDTASQESIKSDSEIVSYRSGQVLDLMKKYEDILGSLDGNAVSLLGDSSGYIQATNSKSTESEITAASDMASDIALLPKNFHIALAAIKKINDAKANNNSIYDRAIKIKTIELSLLRDVLANISNTISAFSDAETIIAKVASAGTTLHAFSAMSDADREAIVN